MMRRLLALLIVALLAGAAAAIPASANSLQDEGARPGQPAPGFTEVTVEGSPVGLDRYRGHALVIWFSNFSEGHLAAAQSLLEVLAAHGNPTLIVVSLDGPFAAEAKQFRERFGGVDVVVDEDGSTARAFTGSFAEGSVPLKNLFLINASGTVVSRHHYPGVSPHTVEDSLRRL